MLRLFVAIQTVLIGSTALVAGVRPALMLYCLVGLAIWVICLPDSLQPATFVVKIIATWPLACLSGRVRDWSLGL